MTNVHTYPGTREERLLRLIYTLWEQLDDHQRAALRAGIEQSDMGWALPQLDRHNDNDWLTIDEAARELGLTRKGLRNWHTRYGLTPIRNLYRWGDIQAIRRQRNMRKINR